MSTPVMQVAIFAGPLQIRIEPVRVPEPGAREVRVRLEGCGVCASNLPVWEGRPWFAYPLEPGSPGHEGWGRIDAVGQEVQGLRLGQRVALLSSHAYAEYDIAPATAVVPLPSAFDGMPFPGEPLGCAMNVLHRSDIQPGHTVAIIGIGFLGALLTRLAVQKGARVIAISRRPFALSIAQQYGADVTLPLVKPWQVLEQVKELTAHTGCDRVIEAVGEQESLDLATEFTRVRGRLIIAGYHQDGARRVNMQIWNWRGLDVVNAHERDPEVCTAGIRAAVRAVACGTVNPVPLYTHAFGLDQLPTAFTMLSQRPDGFLKAYITFIPER